MKKIGWRIGLSAAVWLLASIVPLHAAPWGVVDVYINESADYKEILSSNHQEFAMYRFLTGKPISFALTFQPAVSPEEEQVLRAQLIPQIQAAFSAWPAQTRARILQEASRKKEFKDILELLGRPVRFQLLQEPETAEITFDFDDEKWAAFTFDKEDLSKQKHIRAGNPTFFKGTEEADKLPFYLLHEIGHYYGLGDRYQEGIWGNSPTYSTTGDTDGGAIMASSRGTELTCDDVDGFINLLDLTQFLMKGKWSKRATNGWQSFCGHRKMYVEGKELNRASWFDGTYIYYYNPDGTVKKKEEANISAAYNPFAQPQAAAGPFTGVHRFQDEHSAMRTSVDYTRLGDGRVSGISEAGNLLMLNFEAIRKPQHRWNLTVHYLRGFNGAKRKDQFKQHFEVQAGNVCRIQTEMYHFVAENLHADIHADTQQIDVSAKVTDSSDGAPLMLDLYVSGEINNETYTFTQGNKMCKAVWKDAQIYTEGTETCQEWVFTVGEAQNAVHDYLKNARQMCRYVSALEEQTVAATVASSLRK
jgi:hypothetical protein